MLKIKVASLHAKQAPSGVRV